MSDYTPIPQGELDAMQAREEAATAGTLQGEAKFDATNKNALRTWCVRWVTETGDVIRGIATFENEVDAVFDAHSRTDQPRLRIALQAAQAEIARLKPIALDRADWKKVALKNQAEIERLQTELDEYHAVAQTREGWRGE